MALTEVCSAITERLRLIPGIVQAVDGPPPQLGEDRMLIVYPLPGPSTPLAHRGGNGNPVIQNQDSIVVEWHVKMAYDQSIPFLAFGIPMLDAVRDTLWSEAARNGFGKTIIKLAAVNTDHFGGMGWGGGQNTNETPTLGFRLILDVTHGSEISAGRA